MTVTAPLLLDLILLVLLVYWIISGIRKGFVLTLCSFLAVFLALGGGWYLAQHHYEPVQEALEPTLIEHFQTAAEKHAAEIPSTEASQGISLPPQMEQALQSHWQQSAEAVQDASAEALGIASAEFLAKAIVFLLGFVGVLIVWTILSHVLNLVTKLPVLHAFNKILGGLLGFGKGVLLLMVARWVLCDVLALIPPEVTAESYLLPLLPSLSIFFLPAA